jgi:hypothetical protein
LGSWRKRRSPLRQRCQRSRFRMRPGTAHNL